MEEQNKLQQPLTKDKDSSPEKLEYQKLVYQVLNKLVGDLYHGGFCKEPSENRRYYWVALKGKLLHKYAVLLDAEFKKGLFRDVNLGAGDLGKPVGEKRSLILGMLKLDPTKSFVDPSLEGAYLFSIEKSTEDFKSEPLSRKQGIAFLKELLDATVDQEETEKRFEKAKKEDLEWSIYWAREGSPLALETSQK